MNYINRLTIVIHYSTSPKSTALQWLNPEQTEGKKHPFLFSQCQVKSTFYIIVTFTKSNND